MTLCPSYNPVITEQMRKPPRLVHIWSDELDPLFVSQNSIIGITLKRVLILCSPVWALGEGQVSLRNHPHEGFHLRLTSGDFMEVVLTVFRKLLENNHFVWELVGRGIFSRQKGEASCPVRIREGKLVSNQMNVNPKPVLPIQYFISLLTPELESSVQQLKVVTAHPKYEFGYEVTDHHTGDSHYQKESRDGDKVVGEYALKEPGGNVRTVKYVADKHGFHPVVHNSHGNDHSGADHGHGHY
uniref:Uncharacterized protein n=1 Tax=Timema tahoe TaxID=61484 RepID=A0A7R9IDY6_9NEOP|nr:unnamed protein product [Timema tahoe]